MIVNGINFDNTANVRRNARTVNLDTKTGNETFRYEVGQRVQSSGNGIYKTGVDFTIAERWMENGFAYYKDTNGTCHRTKDILS